MEKKQNSPVLKTIVAVSFLLMVTVNALANIIPINGITTGDVSNSYPNLFAPTALTFSIWGLIYLLLACHTLYYLGLFRGNEQNTSVELLRKTGGLFAISSLANAAWMFSWHYKIIPLSMVLMAVILVCLILINQLTHEIKLSTREKFFIRLPFSVYFGWITVATIANAATLLVSLGWDGFGISEPIWTVLILIVGTIIGLVTMLKNADIAFGLVLLWAYTGILLKHVSAKGFAGEYTEVIAAAIACMVLFATGVIYILIQKIKAIDTQK